MITLSSPLTALKGIGEKRCKDLEKAGIRTVEELLSCFPHAYASGTPLIPSAETVGQRGFFSLTVTSEPSLYTALGKKTVRFAAETEQGEAVTILYYNQPYIRRQIHKGDHAFFFGTLEEKSGVFYLFHPRRQKEAPHAGRLIPLYASIGSMTGAMIEKTIAAILPSLLGEIKDPLPPAVVSSASLMPYARAVFLLHCPTSWQALEEAKERLAFQGLFQFSVTASLFADRTQKGCTAAFSQTGIQEFIDSLPFSLTGAQSRVIDEICRDMTGTGLIPPMNRLLIGDVGSGKTAVAAAAAYLTIKNGGAVLLMAPTEILAKQHYASFQKSFLPFSIPVFLLTGSTTARERKEILSFSEKGLPYLLIGTHALSVEALTVHGVKLVICDEQHRFGVKQRSRLEEKGEAVHTLVMSATPIPRSLAMFLHAKKKISVIDELPPHRQTVETFYVGEDKIERILSFLQEKVTLGQSAFMVCPLIGSEEGESEMHSAVEEYRRVQQALPEIPCALLHGQMKNEEKDEVMRAFVANETKILVSTTVIEVGVDVPQATVMVIRNAERFGLAQLHQLRGRVGRGAEQSYCILTSSHKGKSVRERLRLLCDCHDGFTLAMHDLKTRGPGDFFGTRQSGIPDAVLEGMKLETVEKAAEAAQCFLEAATPEELLPYEKKIGFH